MCVYGHPDKHTKVWGVLNWICVWNAHGEAKKTKKKHRIKYIIEKWKTASQSAWRITRIKINLLALQLWMYDSQTRLDRRRTNNVCDK